MNLYENELYMDDVQYVSELDFPWEMLGDRSVVVSGASGLIGSFLIDVLLRKNAVDGLGCFVYALGRSQGRLQSRFDGYSNDRFVPVTCDLAEPLDASRFASADYVLHLASNTHPLQYATDPIGTVVTNVVGLKNMMDLAVAHGSRRLAFASSNEVYGENRGDVELFGEGYCGYIDCNTLRAGYPESKRCGEALCQAYRAQTGLSVVIPRLTRTYGPTMLMSDTKALSQFIKRGLAGEDIVLKSAGMQHYSYQYVADSVSGLLTVLLRGEDGEAYNIADEGSDVRLRDLARLVADACEREVVFELPDEVEAAGYSTATKARLDGSKLRALGWRPRYDIETGVSRTLEILGHL